MDKRDPQHLERFITALRQIKAKHPHLRIGQIIENGVDLVDESWPPLFQVEDDVLADAVEAYLES